MKEFASWARADASRKDEVASVAFLRFMAAPLRPHRASDEGQLAQELGRVIAGALGTRVER